MTEHHPPTPPGGRAPTARQQRYLRQLAMQRGVTFTPPRTREHASQLLDQLKRTNPEPVADWRRERRGVQADMACGRGDDARARGRRGHRLRRQRDLEARPTVTPSPHIGGRSGRTSERVELGRYTISAGERIIYGQRVLGVVRLLDLAVDGRGRRYVIERGLTSRAELEAIVADYLAQAARWDAPPAEPVCLLKSVVEARLR